MVLTKREKEMLLKLRKAGGKAVTVTVRRGTGNVTIKGKGFKPLTKMITGNVGVSALEVVTARRKLIKKGLN